MTCENRSSRYWNWLLVENVFYLLRMAASVGSVDGTITYSEEERPERNLISSYFNTLLQHSGRKARNTSAGIRLTNTRTWHLLNTSQNNILVHWCVTPCLVLLNGGNFRINVSVHIYLLSWSQALDFPTNTKLHLCLCASWRFMEQGGIAPLIPNLGSRWARVQLHFDSFNLGAPVLMPHRVGPRATLNTQEKFLT